MAGNKINTKTKGKEEKSKANSKAQNNGESEDPDFALLRKPIHTSVTGFGQARKIFDLATEELKNLLSNECDILYECKVCRNIFRSLANFISHKRVYCKEKFNSSVHSHFIKPTSTLNELVKIKRLEQDYQQSLSENDAENLESDEVDGRVPLTKDLTEIVERLAKKKPPQECTPEEPHMRLQKIPSSSVAVFQNIELGEEKQKDNMRVQVKELDNILSKDIAVLQSNGKFKIQSSVPQESDNVIQISDDDEYYNNDALKCKTCDQQFSTQKTLKFHMKYKHVETRLVYPCPDCLEIFSTSWSVYRHLFKVHRKTAAQIRRLRESIQAKAFKMNNPPAFYEKRKNNMKTAMAQKISEEERLDQENQAWMDNMECDGEVPRCGGCGRAFERRAALAAHTHTCQPRSRARQPARHDTKRIEIQIRKDYNKGPPVNFNLPVKTAQPTENKPIKEEIQPTPELQKNDDKVLEDDEKDAEESMDVSEDDQKSNDATESPDKIDNNSKTDMPEPVIRLPFAQHAEKSNQLALRQKIQSDADLGKLLCKKCDVQFNNVQELYDHVAEHYKWMRYACKLCNFKHYNFEKLPEHVKVVHKLKGDKDFYFSTVKAITGTEAMELCEATDELNDANDTSPDSRRPSRCSSDSSRLSDDSSSSNTRVEGPSRKRKVYQSKGYAKKRKDALGKVGDEQKNDVLAPDKDMSPGENDTSSIIRPFEENSSDMDDLDDKIAKRQTVDDTSSVASRRPVRRKAKPKNEDFEYDLSNLLKMEAQGYRDSQSVANTKSSQTKKKIQQEIPINYENNNKDCCGALVTLSKKAIEKSAAHMKISFFRVNNTQKEPSLSDVFVRPMLPKIFSKGEKVSPKKDVVEEKKDDSSPTKESSMIKVNEECLEDKINEECTTNTAKEDINISKKEVNDPSSNKDHNDPSTTTSEAIRTNINIPSVVPIKFRRQSLEVIKNPLINKNIKDFTKAGMKTKILVIKPINRNKDGTKTVNTPLKFQTIKLKDPNRNSSCEDNSSDQVVVVKVPKVDRAITRAVPDAVSVSNEKQPLIKNNINSDSVSKCADNVCKDVETTQAVCSTESEELKSVECIDKSSESSSVTVTDAVTVIDCVNKDSESETIETNSVISKDEVTIANTETPEKTDSSTE